jgi:hypothetical protein
MNCPRISDWQCSVRGAIAPEISKEGGENSEIHNATADDCEGQPMIYLASPYSHRDKLVREQRFQNACRVAGARADRRFLEISDEVVVLTMDGWRESESVQREIQIVVELTKPVNFLKTKRGRQ